jgi:hypothetical protein
MAETAPNLPKPMQVTRSLIAVTPVIPFEMLKALAFLRADIWRRYGGLGTEGHSRNVKSISLLRSECAKRYGELALDGTIRAATTLDILQKIMACRAAAAQQEMVEDLLSIVHTFSCRLYGMRKYKKETS